MGRFPDRANAGVLLAGRLLAGDHRAVGAFRPPAGWGSVVVLGIPRGGVPVAATLARTLGARLDILVAHKIGAPGQPELAVGAVAADGSVRREVWTDMYLPDVGFERAAADEIARARTHSVALRAGRPAIPLGGTTVVLVDDGIATGSTMLVAVVAARGAGATHVIVAVPVASSEAVDVLASVADAVLAVQVPRDLRAVGEWYERFEQVADAEVRRLLAGFPAG